MAKLKKGYFMPNATLSRHAEQCAGIAAPPKDDVVLFSLPYWDVYTPFSANPCLHGALKKAGWRARQVDVGILFFHVLYEKNKRFAFGMVSSRFFFRNHVEPYEKEKVASYEEYLERINFLAAKDLSLQDLRARYPLLSDFQRGILGAFYNAIWIGRRKPVILRTVRLAELVADCDFAPYVEVIKRFNLGELLNSLPDVVGISITNAEQLAPSLAWARFIKLFKPTARLIAGGSGLAVLKAGNHQAWEELLDFFDLLCMGEGEKCIVALCDHVYHGKTALSEIPNLAYREETTIRCTPEAFHDIEVLSPPCYDGIDFSLYLTPQPMLAYQTSRGCFWGKCAFCDFDKRWKSNFRQKSVSKVVHDLKFLHEHYGVSNFTFVDEAIKPKFFAQMVAALEAEDFSSRINWLAYLRISPVYTPELLARAKQCGCRMVMTGVETFNQRLLNFIRKGIKAETAIMNLQDFHAAGITTHAWLLALLPSQTKDELLADFECIKKYNDLCDSMHLGSFILLPSTDIFNEPARFNITDIRDSNDPSYRGYDFVSADTDGALIDKAELVSILNEKIRPYLAGKILFFERYITFFNEMFFLEEKNRSVT